MEMAQRIVNCMSELWVEFAGLNKLRQYDFNDLTGQKSPRSKLAQFFAVWKYPVLLGLKVPISSRSVLKAAQMEHIIFCKLLHYANKLNARNITQ